MLKSELVTALVRDNPALPSATVERIVSCLFDTITDCLPKAGGSSCAASERSVPRARDGRTGRNPRSGDAVAVEVKRILHFKAGKSLSQRVDASRKQDDTR